MSDKCDHCGLPYATLYVLATDLSGSVILSHFMCDTCNDDFNNVQAESDDDDSSLPTVQSLATITESEAESEKD
jgi:hypothetical protein